VFDLGRFVKTPRLAALAADDEIDEIAGGSSLIQPKLSSAFVLRTVDKPVPVHVIDVPGRTSPNKTRSDHRAPVDTAFGIQGLPVHESTRSLSVGSADLFLDDKPLGKAVHPDTSQRNPRVT
jgi:hypothetical protein